MDGQRLGTAAKISLDAAFPKRCWHCDAQYLQPRWYGRQIGGAVDKAHPFGEVMAEYLCPPCRQLYESVESPLCFQCGLPFVSHFSVDHLCNDCMRHPFDFSAARAAGLYNQMLKAIIHIYKYHGRIELARPLGGLLWDAFHRFYDVKAFDLIIPVPLHWFRRMRRGFNQAALLVHQWKKLADLQGVAFNPDMICENRLYRYRYTAPQTGLGKRRRAANLKNAFKVKNRQDVHDKCILLVDDVITTGATVDACAKALKRAGAGDIKVLTLARAL